MALRTLFFGFFVETTTRGLKVKHLGEVQKPAKVFLHANLSS